MHIDIHHSTGLRMSYADSGGPEFQAWELGMRWNRQMRGDDAKQLVILVLNPRVRVCLDFFFSPEWGMLLRS